MPETKSPNTTKAIRQSKTAKATVTRPGVVDMDVTTKTTVKTSKSDPKAPKAKASLKAKAPKAEKKKRTRKANKRRTKFEDSFEITLPPEPLLMSSQSPTRPKRRYKRKVEPQTPMPNFIFMPSPYGYPPGPYGMPSVSGVMPSGVMPSGVMPSGVMPSGVMPSASGARETGVDSPVGLGDSDKDKNKENGPDTEENKAEDKDKDNDKDKDQADAAEDKPKKHKHKWRWRFIMFLLIFLLGMVVTYEITSGRDSDTDTDTDRAPADGASPSGPASSGGETEAEEPKELKSSGKTFVMIGWICYGIVGTFALWEVGGMLYNRKKASSGRGRVEPSGGENGPQVEVDQGQGQPTPAVDPSELPDF